MREPCSCRDDCFVQDVDWTEDPLCGFCTSCRKVSILVRSGRHSFFFGY